MFSHLRQSAFGTKVVFGMHLLVAATPPAKNTLSIRRKYNMMTMLKQLWRDEEGQDLTEYALLLVLISLIAVASLRVAGQAVSDAFSNAAANLTTNT